MTGTPLRRLISALVAMIIGAMVVVGTAGCAVPNPFVANFEEAIPRALLAADIGVVEATAATTLDGFSTNMGVYIQFEDQDVNAQELEMVLAIMLDHANMSGLSDMRVVGWVGDQLEGTYINTAELGRELGFEDPDPEADSFDQRWGDVLAYFEAKK